MEVEQTWEALDLDDSDLASLLRPCKRRRPTPPSTAAVAAVNLLSQPASPKVNHLEQEQPPPSASCHRRTIPGPAGAVQAAMLRKNLDRQNQVLPGHQVDTCEGFNGNIHNNGVISTQEYIRRAVDDTAEFDDDFTRHPWLSALQFLGAENGLIPSTPISSIKKCFNSDKVVQVVAVIKSCTPNGLGGLMVLLKDPTGTVGASIHHGALSQDEYGKNLSIGAVLIIRQVAIFSPLRSIHYLNITQRNLVKVFCQNSGSTSKLCNSAYPVQYADPVYCGKANTIGTTSIMQNVTREDAEKSQCSRSTGTENSQNHCSIQRLNLFTGSSQSNNRGCPDISSAQRRHINLRQHAHNEVPEDSGDDEEFVNGSEKGGYLEGSATNTDNMTNSFTKCRGEDIQGICDVENLEMQKQPMILKASLPQWTEEQLDQLFAGEDEDDASLF